MAFRFSTAASRFVTLFAFLRGRFPRRTALLVLNVAVGAWLIVNIFTRLGICVLMMACGIGLIAISIGNKDRITEVAAKTVRLSPISFTCVYLMFGIGEVFLRFNPLLVGGGGGGNPALKRMYEGLYSINEHGFRGPEFSETPEAGVFRLLVIGDSFTFGQGVGEGETYPDQLRRMLNDNEEGQIYEVLNAGQSGTDTFEQLTKLKMQCLKFHPDLIVVQFYMNDLEPRIQAVQDPLGFVDEYLMLPAHESYAVFFLKYRFDRLADGFAARTNGVDTSTLWIDNIAKGIATNNVGWQRFGQAVDGLAHVQMEEHTPIVFVLLPHPGLSSLESLRSVHKAVRERIQSAGLLAIDFADVWSALSANDQVVSEIDHHPSALAHKLTAQKLATELTQRWGLPEGIVGK